MLEIELLGKPRITRDGEPVAPKGKKVWALLAFLLLADTPPERARLASLLFEDAADPLATLRWNLAELRRVLGLPDVARGDPVRLALPDSTGVDVRTVLEGSWADAVGVDGLGSDLLAGLHFDGAPAFEAWLASHRLHLMTAGRAQLKEAARARLATGDAAAAAGLAGRLVEADRFDENAWSLFLRSLVTAGDPDGAARQFEQCRKLFAEELGVEPGPQVVEAARAPSRTDTPATLGSARAQLDAGKAAIGAGALEAGLHCLRRAATEAASQQGGAPLRAEALFELGSSLVHAAKGRDEEGAGALEEALDLARRDGFHRIAADASRELGYIEMLRGNAELAERMLRDAREESGDDADAGARVDAVLGVLLSDVGRYAEAFRAFEASAAVAQDLKQTKQVAWVTAFEARARLLRGELDAAELLLRRCLESVREMGWAVFVPWPEALLGDVLIARGDVDGAADLYEHAFALGCQVSDPCWEGMGARGLGLVKAARGDLEGAVRTLDDAARRCMRLPDAYVWIRIYSLDALASLAASRGLDGAAAWIAELRDVSSRSGAREFVARSYVHEHVLGDPDALETARHLAHGIDNPALATRLA